MKVVVIGGVAGGASFATRMRRLDEFCDILILERGEHIAFANCGLPYHIGEIIECRDDLILFTPRDFSQRFNIDVRTHSEVVDIDRINKTLTVKNIVNGNSFNIQYDKLVISTGADPVKLQVPGINYEGVFTLRSMSDMDRIKSYIDTRKPKTAIIVGGGYIGLEMVENLVNLGISTTVVERGDHLVAPLDYDISTFLHSYVKSKDVVLKLNTSFYSIEIDSSGIIMNTYNGTLSADIVIVSVGVRAESNIAEAAGLEVNKNGTIAVNESMLTSDPDIYAIGDVADVISLVTGEKEFIPLAGPANKQGRIVANLIVGIGDKYKGTQGSAILKIFDMTVALTGVNERVAKNKGLEYDVMVINSSSHASYYPGAEKMWIKAVYERCSGKILGAQLVGFAGVDKRCDVLAVAIRLGLTASDLRELELCYAPPFSSAKDPVNILGCAIENVVSGLVKTAQWHDVCKLPRDGSVNLVDVRDYIGDGVIDGFINIPLSEIRNNIHKLDKNKPTYVHCFVGGTSYLACRILSEHGFDCYNICGGYQFYNSIYRADD